MAAVRSTQPAPRHWKARRQLVSLAQGSSAEHDSSTSRTRRKSRLGEAGTYVPNIQPDRYRDWGWVLLPLFTRCLSQAGKMENFSHVAPLIKDWGELRLSRTTLLYSSQKVSVSLYPEAALSTGNKCVSQM